ncbi:hypothetical protein DJ71_03925, partial [Halorubrum sp. E3]
ALAEPREEGWLTDRIDKFGPRPIAYLLGSDEGIPPTFDDVAESSFMDRSVGWLPVTEPVGRRYVGVVAKNE